MLLGGRSQGFGYGGGVYWIFYIRGEKLGRGSYAHEVNVQSLAHGRLRSR